jgi:hypothetical protein
MSTVVQPGKKPGQNSGQKFAYPDGDGIGRGAAAGELGGILPLLSRRGSDKTLPYPGRS